MIIYEKIKDITYEFDNEHKKMRVTDNDQFENIMDINDIKKLIDFLKHLNDSKLV